jgi:cytochrome c biogenesis protein CcmG/thiol:disulfide interchange protein DsbE
MNKLPLAIFIILLGLFLVPMLKHKNPAVLDSALLGKPMPIFKLPPALKEKEGFTPKDLKHETVLINFFASWCTDCVAEQDALATIGVPVYGIAYKDKAEKLAPWLTEHGDPYMAIIADEDGRAAIDWGVYGVPETFVVDKGVIRGKIVGAVTMENLQDVMKQ